MLIQNDLPYYFFIIQKNLIAIPNGKATARRVGHERDRWKLRDHLAPEKG